MLPAYLHDLFPPTVSYANPYNLRNSTNFATIARRTEIYSKSVIPSSLQLWNEFGQDIRESVSLPVFKRKLKAVFRSPAVPMFYSKGERISAVHHARLRNNCSNLKADLHRNHLIPSSQCDCGQEIEDAEH